MNVGDVPQPPPFSAEAELEFFLPRIVPFRLDLRILSARNEPVPFALDQKERQPVISAGVSAPVRENKALHVMREDGNSGILRGEPYNNCSNMAAGVLKHMLVGPSGSAPMLRLPTPQTPRYVYPVGVIRE